MYLCYGDDCINHDKIAYAIVGMNADSIELFVKNFALLKVQYGLKEDTTLHCRELFNGDRRKKNLRLATLNYSDVQKLSCNLIHLYISYSSISPIYVYTERKNFPSKFHKKQRIETGQFDEKQGLHFLKNCSLLELYNFFDKDETKFVFYADKLSDLDKCSKNSIRLNGVRSRQQMQNFIVPPALSGSSERGDYRIPEVKFESAPYKTMYEIADFVVYVITKAICFTHFTDKASFKTMQELLKPRFVYFDYNLGIVHRIS